MQGPARILIVGNDVDNDKKLEKAITDFGFECSIGDITECASELCGSRRPDVVLLNMQSEAARQNPETFLALAKTLKGSALSTHMRIILVGVDKELELSGGAGDIDDMLVGPINTKQVCYRIRSLVRLNTMHEELVRRLNTSAKYGLDAPVTVAPPRHIDNATVLVLGDPNQFAMIEHSLAKQATLVGALSEATAFDYLSRRDFDAILINAADTLDPYVPFVKEVRKKSRLYNLPIIALAPSDNLTHSDKLYENGFTDAVAKPYSCDELMVRVNLLVRESRFRDSLKQIYQEAKHLATSDALTGLYSRGFLFEHLETMAKDANRTSQGFSIATMSIANIGEINAQLGYAGGDRIIRQVGEVIGLLVRGEDLPARYSGAKFILALPDTPVDRAQHAIQRITGVVAHTEFVVENHYAPISVTLETTLTGFEPGDTAQMLIARSRGMDLKAAA